MLYSSDLEDSLLPGWQDHWHKKCSHENTKEAGGLMPTHFSLCLLFILCTPYYLTLVRLNIGICNPGPLSTFVLAVHHTTMPGQMDK